MTDIFTPTLSTEIPNAAGSWADRCYGRGSEHIRGCYAYTHQILLQRKWCEKSTETDRKGNGFGFVIFVCVGCFHKMNFKDDWIASTKMVWTSSLHWYFITPSYSVLPAMCQQGQQQEKRTNSLSKNIVGILSDFQKHDFWEILDTGTRSRPLQPDITVPLLFPLVCYYICWEYFNPGWSNKRMLSNIPLHVPSITDIPQGRFQDCKQRSGDIKC